MSLRNSGVSGWILILFSLPFLAVSIGFTMAIIVRQLERARAMQSWTAVAATIESCELRQSHSGKGGVTQQTLVTYRYRIAGQEYCSDVVSLGQGSDNIGSYQSDIYRIIKAAQTAQHTLTCYVNPADATQSILFRQVRPEMLLFYQVFILAFGGIALLTLGQGLLQIGRARAQSKLTMRTSKWPQAILVGGVGGVALVLTTYIYFTAQQLLVPQTLPWYSIIPVVVSFIPLMGGIYFVVQVVRFGVSTLELQKVSRVGENLQATVSIQRGIAPNTTFEAKLVCLRREVIGGGRSRHVKTTELWHQVQAELSGYSMGTYTTVPLHFQLPANQPATTKTKLTRPQSFAWHLELRSNVSRPRYCVSFVLQVDPQNG